MENRQWVFRSSEGIRWYQKIKISGWSDGHPLLPSRYEASKVAISASKTEFYSKSEQTLL
ncbi:hypothetical protein [Aquiflexum gelatinilyticum]|uniref:Uncharacterized protein n=1 Tax=Aquiflexum gelatinilyticum TaxID=2961943 RepID=A0A9X2SYS9_9BACT|nr:hypothetical protein [Aquiflexum gelatinilyticum]MCR9015559.1 hypothetical protein [Aquiflexum gelatinilyticum]